MRYERQFKHFAAKKSLVNRAMGLPEGGYGGVSDDFAAAVLQAIRNVDAISLLNHGSDAFDISTAVQGGRMTDDEHLILSCFAKYHKDHERNRGAPGSTLAHKAISQLLFNRDQKQGFGGDKKRNILNAFRGEPKLYIIDKSGDPTKGMGGDAASEDGLHRAMGVVLSSLSDTQDDSDSDTASRTEADAKGQDKVQDDLMDEDFDDYNFNYDAEKFFASEEADDDEPPNARCFAHDFLALMQNKFEVFGGDDDFNLNAFASKAHNISVRVDESGENFTYTFTFDAPSTLAAAASSGTSLALHASAAAAQADQHATPAGAGPLPERTVTWTRAKEGEDANAVSGTYKVKFDAANEPVSATVDVTKYPDEALEATVLGLIAMGWDQVVIDHTKVSSDNQKKLLEAIARIPKHICKDFAKGANGALQLQGVNGETIALDASGNVKITPAATAAGAAAGSLATGVTAGVSAASAVADDGQTARTSPASSAGVMSDTSRDKTSSPSLGGAGDSQQARHSSTPTLVTESTAAPPASKGSELFSPSWGEPAVPTPGGGGNPDGADNNNGATGGIIHK